MHGTQLFEKATNIAIESPSTWKSVTFLSKPTVKPPQGAVPSASSLKPSRETLAFSSSFSCEADLRAWGAYRLEDSSRESAQSIGRQRQQDREEPLDVPLCGGSLC